MKKHPPLQTAILCLGLLALSSVQAETLSKADYKTGKTHIQDTYKTDKAACQSHSGHAKNVCQQEAKAKEKVAHAELEYSYTGKTTDGNKVHVVKAETAYTVAKERCKDHEGNARNVCIQEAKATEQKALAEARKEAAVEKMEAEYKLAIEKCDALAGEAKTHCEAAAKVKFGKH